MFVLHGHRLCRDIAGVLIAFIAIWILDIYCIFYRETENWRFTGSEIRVYRIRVGRGRGEGEGEGGRDRERERESEKGRGRERVRGRGVGREGETGREREGGRERGRGRGRGGANDSSVSTERETGERCSPHVVAGRLRRTCGADSSISSASCTTLTACQRCLSTPCSWTQAYRPRERQGSVALHTLSQEDFVGHVAPTRRSPPRAVQH